MSQYLGSVANKRSLSNEFLGKVSRSFKDLSFNFTTNPITKDIVVLKNEEAIKQSVKNNYYIFKRRRIMENRNHNTQNVFEINQIEQLAIP